MPPSLRHTTPSRVLGALVAAGLLTVTAGAWTPATSAAPAPVVYVDWSDTRPLAGQRTVVAGVLGPAEEGQVVHLDRFLPDERRWVSAARQQASISFPGFKDAG